MKKLPIHDMHERHRGLTPLVAGGNLEAARVLLDHHHTPPTEFSISVDDAAKEAVGVEWVTTDQRTRDAWANTTDRTEQAAYAMVLAATELQLGLVALKRAETLTGADYYLHPLGSDPVDLEECYRLEVSGLDEGTDTMVASRLEGKLAQTQRGKSNLPALAGVVGFKVKLILLQKVVAP